MSYDIETIELDENYKRPIFKELVIKSNLTREEEIDIAERNLIAYKEKERVFY